jgi:uncharacterized protein DUF3800
MTVHAFVDESRRGSTYFVAGAIAIPADLRQLRRELNGLLLPRQRELHFHTEKDPRRRGLADAIARLPAEVQIYTRSCERSDEPARQKCLEQVIRDLLDRGAHRLVIDSRSHRDKSDEATIRGVVARHPHTVPLVYEHLESTSEPMLWIADAAAWCFKRGGQWRKRIDQIISGVIDLD